MPNKPTFVNSNTRGVTPLIVDSPNMPAVFYSAIASKKIHHFVDNCSKEIAWFGLVDELPGGDYLITDIFLPDQTVTHTTVDVSSEDVAQLALELMDMGYDPAKLRYHGHSHVNMQTSPSGTDQEHIADYLEHAPWFIRGIYNKKGESKIDVFDKRVGLIYQCVATEIWELAQTAQFYKELDVLIKERLKEPKSEAKSLQLPEAQITRFDFRQSYRGHTPSQLKADQGFWDHISDKHLDQMQDPFFQN